MEGRSLRQPFNGGDLAALDLAGCNQARTSWFAVQQNRAGSAVPRVTAHFRTGQTQIVPEHTRKPPRTLRCDLNATTVDGKRNLLRRRFLARRYFSRRHVSGPSHGWGPLPRPIPEPNPGDIPPWREYPKLEPAAQDVRLLRHHEFQAQAAIPQNRVPNRQTASPPPNMSPPQRVPQLPG